VPVPGEAAASPSAALPCPAPTSPCPSPRPHCHLGSGTDAVAAAMPIGSGADRRDATSSGPSVARSSPLGTRTASERGGGRRGSFLRSDIPLLAAARPAPGLHRRRQGPVSPHPAPDAGFLSPYASFPILLFFFFFLYLFKKKKKKLFLSRKHLRSQVSLFWLLFFFLLLLLLSSNDFSPGNGHGWLFCTAPPSLRAPRAPARPRGPLVLDQLVDVVLGAVLAGRDLENEGYAEQSFLGIPVGNNLRQSGERVRRGPCPRGGTLVSVGLPGHRHLNCRAFNCTTENFVPVILHGGGCCMGSGTGTLFAPSEIRYPCFGGLHGQFNRTGKN